jgi:hypothetical protein
MTIESTHVRGDATPRRIATAWGWWAVQLFVAIYGFAHMFFSQFDTDSCAGRECDYATYTAVLHIFNLGDVVLLLAAAVAILLLRNHPRIAVWCPVVGIILTVTLLIVCIALSRAALDLPTLEM